MQGKKWICSAYPKVGKLEGNVLSYRCCEGEFLGGVVPLCPAILGECLVVGGRRGFGAASSGPSNVGMMRFIERDPYLRHDRCAMFFLVFFPTRVQILQPCNKGLIISDCK